MERVITSEELALFGLRQGELLPSGGKVIRATVQSGNQSGYRWAEGFSPLFAEWFGVELYRGTFNLNARESVQWIEPLELDVGEAPPFEFLPLIVEESAVGVAMRRGVARPDLLEILSPIRMRDVVGVGDGAEVSVRLLPGSLLQPRLQGTTSGERLEQSQRVAHLLQRVGYALWQLAEVEYAAATHVVVRLRAVKGAGLAMAEPIEAAVHRKTFGQIVSELRDSGMLEERLALRLQALLNDRNWLVHRAKRESRGVIHDAAQYESLVSRLDRIADDALALQKDLAGELEGYVLKLGVSREYIDKEAQRLAREWGYD
ncbi:MAG TPA: hypothetical protein VGJ18_07955 [Gemmatimonadaceae bacterium]|jgi:hypothetical protein